MSELVAGAGAATDLGLLACGLHLFKEQVECQWAEKWRGGEAVAAEHHDEPVALSQLQTQNGSSPKRLDEFVAHDSVRVVWRRRERDGEVAERDVKKVLREVVAHQPSSAPPHPRTERLTVTVSMMSNSTRMTRAMLKLSMRFLGSFSPSTSAQ